MEFEHDEYEDDETEGWTEEGIHCESDLAEFLTQAIERHPDSEIVTSVRSYKDAGVLTMNEGIVVSLKGGGEYQITIVRSR